MALVATHLPAVHATVAHVVALGVQSLVIWHWMQVPIPSHFVPPLSVQAVPAGAFATPQQPPSQVLDRHTEESAGQSAGVTHLGAPAQLPPAPVLAALELVELAVVELVVPAPRPPSARG
jgi:hypothetical protein